MRTDFPFIAVCFWQTLFASRFTYASVIESGNTTVKVCIVVVPQSDFSVIEYCWNDRVI